jgi:hypothetical protein
MRQRFRSTARRSSAPFEACIKALSDEVSSYDNLKIDRELDELPIV